MIVHDAANRVVKLQIGDKNCALRMPKLDDAQLNVDRRSEYAAIRAASAADLAPEVLGFDVESGAMITRWIDAPVWTPVQARESSRIELIAATLRRLHELPPPADVRLLDLESQLHGYKAALQARPEGWPADFDSPHAATLKVLRERPPGTHRLCHNDLHSGNLIGTGTGFRLLDWEYSGRGDPLFDLASYVQSNDLESGQKQLLLESYGATASMQARFPGECLLFDWTCILWLAVSGMHRTAEGAERFATLLHRQNWRFTR